MYVTTGDQIANRNSFRRVAPLLMLERKLNQRCLYRRYGKRILDLVASVTGLLLLVPLIVFTAILVRWKLGRPVFFWQERAGLDGSCFQILKFRSMTDERDQDGHLLPDDKRLTTFGKLLRRLRLDEVLQLWNVIRGEMSCIGPRPALFSYLDHYDAFQHRRLEVLPGMTGWSQVNGNVRLPWDERMILDVWYIDHCSPSLDLKIMLLTWQVLFFGEHPNYNAIEEAKRHAECLNRSGR